MPTNNTVAKRRDEMFERLYNINNRLDQLASRMQSYADDLLGQEVAKEGMDTDAPVPDSYLGQLNNKCVHINASIDRIDMIFNRIQDEF